MGIPTGECQEYLEVLIEVWIPAYLGALGRAHTLSGRIGDAMPLLEEAVVRAAKGNRVCEELLKSWLSEGLLLAGRTERAAARACRAVQLCRDRRDRGDDAHATWTLGNVVLHGNAPDLDQGENHYEYARVLATELGMRPLVAHCHAGLAKLHRRTGKPIEADEHFRIATVLYREMGMTYWLEKAEKENETVPKRFGGRGGSHGRCSHHQEHG